MRQYPKRLVSIEAAEKELEKYIPTVREITGKDITLERMAPLMEVLGNPQNKLKIIHVAGTSGKTSTAYYIANLLQKQGRKIGLTVSPHIDSVTERVQINLKPLDEWSFCTHLEEFLDLIKTVDPQPSYFELLVAFAYWYFDKVEVDCAVVETGFGGLFDGTNIAQGPDKVCVITDIGIDHTKILGDTLPLIAAQKAGIIHKNNQAFAYSQPTEVNEEFLKRSKAVGAELELYNQEELLQKFDIKGLHELPLFQQRNWLLARNVCDYVAKKWNLPIDKHQIKRSLQTKIPGRMSISQLGGITLVMDGSHNEQKTQALVRSFRELYPDKKPALLVSFRQGKDSKEAFRLLRQIADTVIVTSFEGAQDLPFPSMEVGELSDLAKAAGFSKVMAEPNAAKAYSKLLEISTDLALVTGSFYLIGLIRQQQRARTVRLIAAIDDKYGLADETGIPWNLPSDLAFLRSKTMGGALLMGYNTYAEFDNPLAGRRNLVIVRPGTQVRAGFEAVENLEDFFNNYPDNLWLFGGAGAFEKTLKYSQELYITRVKGDFGCTKFLPEFEKIFLLVDKSQTYEENGTRFYFERWTRKY